MSLKTFISKVNSWNDFKTVLETKTKLEKGKAFEELTKYYLEYNPVYKSKLKNVWLQNEITPSILKKLNLPTNDQGIDLIAETIEGKFWAIQCKYLQDEDQRLSHRAISTFVSLSTGIAENITYCLVCTTVDDYAKIYQGKNNIGFCTSDEWRKLDKTFFDWLRNKLSGKEKKLIPYKPKPHQTKALKEAKHYFLKENNSRGKLVFPCGAGKSLTGYWITRELKSKSTIVAVPSLSLVKQTLEVYLRESVANNETIAWLCVCSDEGIGKNDDIAIHTNEIGVPCVTDKNFIANWLKANSKKKTIIFTTYQSGKTIAEACKIAKHSFNLGIMDEAHKTVGDKDKLFSHLLFEQNISVEKRIFMTATERRYAGSSDTVLSMNDSAIYGETFAQMSFKEAIEIGILSDYKIITLFISNDEVKKLIQQNAFVKPEGKEWDKETEARTLASLIALRKAMTDYPIHHAVTFHSSIKKAEAFEKSQSVFSKAYPKFAKVKSYHVSGAMPTSVRGKIVDEFADTEKGIITNAKCLTEGIDVPNIDCVLFADPRKSTVDIVQAVGRALRKKEGKEFGYVILPVFTETNNTDEIIESDEFKEILSTIRALASNDERIVEYFRDISKGKTGNKKDSLIQFDIDVNIASKINAHDLIESIQLKTWNKLAKLSWMPFEEIKLLIQSKRLKNQKDYRNYLQNKNINEVLPAAPDKTYKNKGWLSWGDFLGSGIIAARLMKFVSFSEAKDFARKNNLKSKSEWYNFLKSTNQSFGIPKNPAVTYKNEWKGWNDFFGTKKLIRNFIEFNEAKDYIKNMKFKSSNEWQSYCISGNKPDFIPSNPPVIYKEVWQGWADFMGRAVHTDYLNKYKSYTEAKEFVKINGIRSGNEWKEFCRLGKKPIDLPSNLEEHYKDNWVSMGDFLGTNRIAPSKAVYRSFDECKIYVKKLGLKSQNEWFKHCKLGIKPIDIPTNPQRTFKYDGWKNWPDFFSTKNIANRLRKFLSYDEASIFVKNLNLKSNLEWRKFSNSPKKPFNIPSNPDRHYKNKGWKGWADFLGKE